MGRKKGRETLAAGGGLSYHLTVKRLLAALLCASLPLGSVEAAVVARVLPRASAVPALTVSVPLAAPLTYPQEFGIRTPANDFKISAPVPAAPTAAVPAAARTPDLRFDIEPAVDKPFPAAPVPSAAAPIAARPQLDAVAALPAAELAGRVFDGGGRAAAPQAAAPEAPRASAWSRLKPWGRAPKPKKPKVPTLENAIKNGLGLGVFLAALAPVAWGALPLHALTYGIGAGIFLPAVAVTALTLYRLARRLAGRAPPPKLTATRRARWKAAVAGMLVGLTLTTGALEMKAGIVETAAQVAAPQSQIVRLEDRGFSAELRAQLAANPVGRDVLEHLKDRGGVVRMPDFYFAKDEPGVAATYESFTDSVFIARDELSSRGWTVEELNRDPAKQRELAREFQSTFAHELRHANQLRRSPLWPGHWGGLIETEHEAFLTEHFYAHERLKADPTVKLDLEYYDYLEALGDLRGWLKGISEIDVYAGNSQKASRGWSEHVAALEKAWPAHQVEGYELLARRELAAGHPRQAREHLAKAAQIAAAHKLPPPSLVIPPEAANK